MADTDTNDTLPLDDAADTGTSIAVQDADDTASEPKPKFAGSATFRDSAAKLTQSATDKARAYADEGKAKAGDALDEFSKLMGEAATSVDERLGEQYGKYARSAADVISNFSTTIKAKQVDELIDDARGFVQKSPAIAIGTAAAIGFAVARLIKAGLDASESETDHRDA